MNATADFGMTREEYESRSSALYVEYQIVMDHLWAARDAGELTTDELRAIESTLMDDLERALSDLYAAYDLR